MTNLKTHRRGVLAFGHDHLHLIAGSEGAAESDVSNSGEDTLNTPSQRAGGKSQSQMRNAGQDWCSIEMALEATTARINPEP